MKAKDTSERIAEVVAEMASITEFAEGSISSSSNSYTLKDGTRRKAKPHWKFQSLGPRGRRKYKNIPAALLPRAKNQHMMLQSLHKKPKKTQKKLKLLSLRKNLKLTTLA